MEKLHQIGFESSVDDFGIGVSSLSYLNQLPVSEIKIDRSFVNKLNENKGSTIVQTIIQLAKNMGLNTVAEGIETEEQLKLIREMACPTAQGFYFYKPMPIEQVDELIN
ncbi:MAG: EAL domain-containing protein [Lysinibacillus sp.]|nr:EAL domain-containing protein [Lysinibacillus sp.]